MNQTVDDVKELSTELINALKPVAQKIGDGAEAIYKMAVKDAVITGIEHWLVVAFGLMLYAVPLIVWLILKKKKMPENPTPKDPVMTAKFEGMYRWIYEHNNRFDSDTVFAIINVSLIIVVFGSILIAFNLGDALHYTFNPEYMALKDLLRAVKH
jgi:hypothetical protein